MAADNYFKRYLRTTKPSARSIWLGIQIARIFDNRDDEASYSLILKNIFPASAEYRKYLQSIQ